VKDAFFVCRGMGYGFRFKDWADFQIGEGGVAQNFAVGDGVTLDFPIYKVYTFGSDTFSRRITRPVTGTAHVFLNGVETFTFFTVNYDTGHVVFAGGHAPAGGVNIALICEFDNPVRFDTDLFKEKITWTTDSETGAVELPAINIVELKENT
jgi:uncharacterized protein (TIGR02217 family)